MERLRALFEALASTLSGRTVLLQLGERTEQEDLNGADACFTARWSDGPITWTESVTTASGNPRDGYGYSIELTLVLPTHQLKVNTGGWDPVPSPLTIEVNCTASEWLALREVLRRELGRENDQGFAPWIAASTLDELARGGELAAALELAKEALARANPTDSERAKLITWIAANDFASGGTAMRVKEAPAVLEGWLELERQGDTTLTETFARLCPFELNRWRAAGLATAPWFDHPAWPFEREAAPEGTWRNVHFRPGIIGPGLAARLGKELTGWETGTDWNDHPGESLPGVEGWRWEVSRRARYADGSRVPVVHVSVHGVRRSPEEWELPFADQYARDYREMIRWSWITGLRSGDVSLLVERSLPIPDRGLGVVAIAFNVIGSEEFRSRAQAAITKLTHLKWHPVPRNASVEPWKRPEPAFTELEGALRAALPPEELSRVQQLMKCGCEDPHCAHRLELRRVSRDYLNLYRPMECAKGEAWGAAAALSELRPDLEKAKQCIREVHENLLHAAEYVE